MDEREADALVVVLQPLLRAYEMLLFVARHFHPPRFASVMAQIGVPDEDLRHDGRKARRTTVTRHEQQHLIRTQQPREHSNNSVR
ncbi:MAG: hypothetical protein SGI91_14425, partial [Alphaproteobacteria bacterium]|nr:hypothetical protein [Alphaproteobacteria bacterium]